MEEKFKVLKEFEKSGAHIGEAAIKKDIGRFIYGLITRLDREAEIDPAMLKKSLGYMRGTDKTKKELTKRSTSLTPTENWKAGKLEEKLLHSNIKSNGQ